jgi:protein gp37
MARRLQAMGMPSYEDGFTLKCLPQRLDEPVKRSKPTMYFVNSMSDLFHINVPDSYIQQVFEVMRATPQHRYQVLTKRAKRASKFFENHTPPDNAWIGVTAENRQHGLPRIELLRSMPAKIRFLSIEPLLEDLGEVNLDGIHWVIVGGESGHRARLMQPEWATSLRDQCLVQEVPFFFKQWGGWGPDGVKRNKKLNGSLLEGKSWKQMPCAEASFHAGQLAL